MEPRAHDSAPPATVYQQDLSTWKTTTISVASIDSGTLHGRHAWLVCLVLQFSCPANDRFKKANIMLSFEPTCASSPLPVVKRWAPQFLTGHRTTSSVEWTFEAALTAGIDLPAHLAASSSLARKETVPRDHVCSIVSSSYKAPHAPEPHAVRFYIAENEAARGGIPARLHAVLVVQSAGACRGRATVETNGIKARWVRGHGNPIELEVGRGHRERWPEAEGGKEFAGLSQGEWEALATPRLGMR